MIIKGVQTIRAKFKDQDDPSNLINQIGEPGLYVIMSKASNPQLEFFIKLTEIIGRTFTDLQLLLSTELKRQQQGNNIHPSISSNLPLQLPQIIPSIPAITHEQQKASQSQHSEQENQQQKKPQIKKVKKIKIKKAKKIEKKQHPKKKKQKPKKAPVDGRPIPPLNAFMLYLKQNKQQIMKKRPDLSPSEVSTYASTVWNSLAEEEKEKYKQIYRRNHDVYLEEMRQFKLKEKTNSSPKKSNQKLKPTFKTHLRPNRRRLKRMTKKLGEQQIICLQSDEQQNQQNEDQNQQI